MFTDFQDKEHERKLYLLDRKIENAKMKASKHKIQIERILQDKEDALLMK